MTDRYEAFTVNGQPETVPFLPIPESPADRYEIYRAGQTRLDRVSNQHYGSPVYDWLVVMANPEAGSLEWDFPDGILLRIPFPLENALNAYRAAVDTYRRL